jgi:hypothetical protein
MRESNDACLTLANRLKRWNGFVAHVKGSPRELYPLRHPAMFSQLNAVMIDAN